MIRMIMSKSAGHAKAYFRDALAKADYYVNDQELPGHWQGLLAARLGLSGETKQEDFYALCESRHPVTGGNLTQRVKEGRRTGYDINFHCPKSVSIMHALSKDNRILNAFRASVTETMQEIEADVKTRVRVGGAYEDRSASELAWAHFVHQTARPVEGFAPDPHLHSHCFVFNATWDAVEKRIKAGEFHDIKRDMPYYQAAFQKRLADNLTIMGFQVRPTKKSFEIADMPLQVIELFSKRTDEIGRVAKEKGISDAKELAELGAKTRGKKQKGMSMAELRMAWEGQIKSLEKLPTDKGKSSDTVPSLSKLTAKDCIDYALLHCFERASVVPERKLIEEAIKFSMGHMGISVAGIKQAFAENPEIIRIKEKSQVVCSTKEILREEQRMVDLAKRGQGSITPLYLEAPATQLDGKQERAAAHVLTTGNLVSIIRGIAGSGKTTLMRHVKDKIEKAGKQLIVVSPGADNARGNLRAEKFDGAETVAKLLVSPQMQEKLKGQVLMVDEAGLLGTKDMLGLLELATKHRTQVILVGDTKQHASVVRGDALRILNTVGGIQAAEVDKIYRQRVKEYRDAVLDLSKGEVATAFAKLEKIGAIQTVDPLEPNKQIVDDYIQMKKSGKVALIVCPTHEQGEALTKAIRQRFRSDGDIGKKEIAFTRLKNLSLTEAQRTDARNFMTGQVIQFNQNVPGIPKGSRWFVDSVKGGNVVISQKDGGTKILPLDKPNRFDVFDNIEIGVSKNDRVRITFGGSDLNGHRLENGQVLDVTSVKKDGITLVNKQSNVTYKLDHSFGHIAHAHAMTSQASQGKTVDAVFIYQPAATFPATDAKQFYVSVSRGRDEVRVYTDDKEALLKCASELRERQSVLEAIGRAKAKSKDISQQRLKEEMDAGKTISKTTKTKTKDRDYEFGS